MTTVRHALLLGIQHLEQEGQRSARLDSQVLLGHVLGVERATLFAYPEREITAEQEQRFLRLIERRKHGEPVAYLIGHEEFYGLDFLVDRRVLIPRPETELLVELALEHIRKRLAADRRTIVADIGTGSGIIPITLAVQEPRLPYVYATDISPDALQVARLNCLRHGVEDRVHLLSGDLLAPLPEPVDILTANLPYVGTDEMSELDRDVRDYEPHLALFSGPHGLDLFQRLFQEGPQSGSIKEGGVLVLEIGYQQKEALTQLLSQICPQAKATFKEDYAGWDRLLQVQI
jgi:release factor glutamine methyltransferase